jgi:hypothetical protein
VRSNKLEDEPANESAEEPVEQPIVHSDDYVQQLAKDCLRFFTASHPQDNNFFSIFVECGITRHIDVKVAADRMSANIHVQIPVPPDELIQMAGYHSTSISLEGTNRIFTVFPPKKLTLEKSELLYFPSKEFPIWLIFKYQFEEEKEEIMEADIYLTNLLTAAAKNSNT